jgi:2,4-didehydro-3-deoxy-L-rhamnonate hydrolase
LLRVGQSSAEKPAMLVNSEIIDLSSILPDIAGDVPTASGLNRLRDIDVSMLPKLSVERDD